MLTTSIQSLPTVIQKLGLGLTVSLACLTAYPALAQSNYKAQTAEAKANISNSFRIFAV